MPAINGVTTAETFNKKAANTKWFVSNVFIKYTTIKLNKNIIKNSKANNVITVRRYKHITLNVFLALPLLKNSFKTFLQQNIAFKEKFSEYAIGNNFKTNSI